MVRSCNMLFTALYLSANRFSVASSSRLIVTNSLAITASVGVFASTRSNAAVAVVVSCISLAAHPISACSSTLNGLKRASASPDSILCL